MNRLKRLSPGLSVMLCIRGLSTAQAHLPESMNWIYHDTIDNNNNFVGECIGVNRIKCLTSQCDIALPAADSGECDRYSQANRP